MYGVITTLSKEDIRKSVNYSSKCVSILMGTQIYYLPNERQLGNARIMMSPYTNYHGGQALNQS